MSKTIVVTGGTSGIGMHTAIGLAKQGHTVVVTGRSRERGEAGVAEIERASGSEDVHLALGDLSRRSGIQQLAEDLLERFERIDVLINNAGYLAQSFERSEDGYEMDFAVNVVAPYRLTNALLPALEASSSARVLNVTGGSTMGKLVVDDLQREDVFVPLPTYSMTKRAMEAMTLVHAQELAQRGVYLNVVYPGAASTSMTASMSSKSLPTLLRPAWPLLKWMVQRDDGGKSAANAARSSIWAAGAPEVEGAYGRYWDTKCKPASFTKQVLDPENQRRVMALIG
ncbi:MAG: SDR family NAD(P)-dependent oxidoreductase [Myxococcota bacterium]